MTGLSGDGIRRGTGHEPVVHSKVGRCSRIRRSTPGSYDKLFQRSDTDHPTWVTKTGLSPRPSQSGEGVAAPLLLTLCGHLTQTTGQPHLTSRYGHSGCGRPRWCLRLVRPEQRQNLGYYAIPLPFPHPPLTVRPTGPSLPRKAGGGGGVTGGWGGVASYIQSPSGCRCVL